MRLILVRHGESEDNLANVHQGWRPSPLTKKGRKQAERVARALAKMKIDHIYASDLVRVQQSLEPLKELLPELSYSSHPALREGGKGEFEGLPSGSIKQAAKEAGKHPYEFTPPGGESYEEMGERVITFAEKIIDEYRESEKTICFYCHGGPIIKITRTLLNLPLERWREVEPKNSTYHLFEITKEGVKALALHVEVDA